MIANQNGDLLFVTDNGITTSTGISANVPVMLAMVEAIRGRETAQRVAGELGVTKTRAIGRLRWTFVGTGGMSEKCQ